MERKSIKRTLFKRLKKVIEYIKECPFYIRRYFDRKRYKNRNLTVISNNCWAGRLYQYLDKPYLSPTAGLFFFADDYLKFITDLRYYLSLELEFISVNESKHSELLNEKSRLAPIGRLGDIEIVFLHYETPDEAKEKWNRRKERINYDDILFKFSRMNGCTDEHVKFFAALPFNNKLLLNNNPEPEYDFEYYIEGYDGKDEIFNDTQPFPGSINIKKVLKKLSKYNGG